MPNASAAEALSAVAVTKHFGGLVAVEAMSFQLAEKEVLGLIGPNGSGKTTMMNLISGALRPNSGEIRLYGEAIAGIGANATGQPQQRRRPARRHGWSSIFGVR